MRILLFDATYISAEMPEVSKEGISTDTEHQKSRTGVNS